jgi:ABC-type transport system substrate-binding protein
LLAGLGWADHDGNGVLEDRSGAEVNFSLAFRADAADRVATANFIRDDLAQVGIRVTVHLETMAANTVGREGATPDQTAASVERKRLDPKEILALKTGLDEVGRDTARAARAWAKMSPQGRKAFATFVPEGDFSGAVRQGLMTPEDQKLASDVQALANGLVKARAGSAVTGSEWKRVAAEIGFPMNDWSAFNSPEVIDHWLERAKQGWVSRVKNTRSVYGNLWGKTGADVGP